MCALRVALHSVTGSAKRAARGQSTSFSILSTNLLRKLTNLLRKLNEGTETPLHVGPKNEALGVDLGMGSLESSVRNEGTETSLHVGLKNEALEGI